MFCNWIYLGMEFFGFDYVLFLLKDGSCFIVKL